MSHLQVIDLSRLIAGFCADAFASADLRERFFASLFKAADWTLPWTTPLPKHRETNVLLLLRTLANSFQEGSPIDQGSWVSQVRPHG
jgi:phospholipase A-2-activating protein